MPSSKNDFLHNGQFEIAIIWSLPQGRSKDQLSAELHRQNNCSEVIVLEELKAFQDLPIYTRDSLSKLGDSDSDIIRNLALKRSLPSVFGLCMAAGLYPHNFQMDRMVEFLSKRFSEVRKMQPKGRSNVISAFIQTKPPLLTFRHGKSYRWAAEFDSVIAAAELTELIAGNFDAVPPSGEELKAVRD